MRKDSGGWRSSHAAGTQPGFPPSVAIAIKALACQLPHESGVPLSRWSVAEIRREAIERGLVASIGETTVWRWLTKMLVISRLPTVSDPFATVHVWSDGCVSTLKP